MKYFKLNLMIGILACFWLFYSNGVHGKTNNLTMVKATCTENINSNVQVVLPTPTTQLRTFDCGINLSAFNQFIYADIVSGADAYQFRFDDGVTTTAYIRSDGVEKIKPSWVNGLSYNANYSVQVRARVSGVWGNYGNSCQVSTPATPPLTKLRDEDIGITLGDFNQFIYADPVIGADKYQFRFCTPTDTTSYIRSDGNQKIKVSWTDDLKYATTYNIDIRTHVDGQWGSYGVANQITSPASVPLTGLCTNSCGGTVNTMCDDICANCGIYGATAYQFKLDNGTNTLTYIRSDGVATIEAGWVNNLSFNTTYDVQVRTKVEGSWTVYGNSCQLNIGNMKTKLKKCPNTNVALNENVFAETNGCQAEKYRYHFKSPDITMYPNITYTATGQDFFTPNSVPGLALDITYDVEVEAFHNGNWTGTGDVCEFRICSFSNCPPQAPSNQPQQTHRNSILTTTSQVLLYPNPTSGQLTIQLENEIERHGNIQIFNLLGQEIFNQNLQEKQQILSLNISDFPKGTYIVHLQSGNQKWIEKLVKD